MHPRGHNSRQKPTFFVLPVLGRHLLAESWSFFRFGSDYPPTTHGALNFFRLWWQKMETGLSPDCDQDRISILLAGIGVSRKHSRRVSFSHFLLQNGTRRGRASEWDSDHELDRLRLRHY